MNMSLHDALTKHLELFEEEYEKNPVIYLCNESDQELFRITDTLSFCEKNGEPYDRHEKDGACICIKVNKTGTTAKISAIGVDFIDIETKEAFIYGYTFADHKKGIDKCLEILKTVFGIKSENHVKVRTEVGKRIYRTESLLKRELQHQSTSILKRPNEEESKTSSMPKVKEEITLGEIFMYATFACVFLFVAYMTGKDVIYYPLKTSNGSYEVKQDGSIDISNFKEWDKSGFSETVLPEMDAVYVWCLEDGSSLPHGVISEDPQFKTVTYNGKKLRVVYIDYCSNLNEQIREECTGSAYRGNILNNTLGELMGYGLTNSKSRSMKIVDEARIPIIQYIQGNLRLFYWEYYSGLFRNNNIRYDTKDLIDILQPPFNSGISR